MALSAAMSRALDLHPARTIPRDHKYDNEADRSTAFKALNRTRASLTSDSWAEKVLAFHRLYNVPAGEQGTVQQLDGYRRVLRQRLLREEVEETLNADDEGDIIETVDGLLDTIYVALGWMLELGMTPDMIARAMDEVHASNMTKVDSEGKPVFDEGGKVLKGDEYIPVNLVPILEL